MKAKVILKMLPYLLLAALIVYAWWSYITWDSSNLDDYRIILHTEQVGRLEANR